jgi:hypothetical protein
MNEFAHHRRHLLHRVKNGKDTLIDPGRLV